ncbi:MAG: NADH-quinone oxidoreductase subunit NuoE [Halocynthiibacter sp.]
MLRRLHHTQPEDFTFTPANLAWAEGQITKYPEGRQASAIIPLLWRAQEQEGWLTRPAMECVANMLGLANIRALEVASFYFMFQLQPVGSVAHIQVCGTTSCMICGAEDLVGVCRDRIADKAHQLSPDGRFSWEEVECLGACANAPVAQVGKDYYEDLTAARLGEILDQLAAGKVPLPGPQNGRYAAEPLSGLTTLTEYESGRTQYNGSVQRAVDIGDTVKRIDGTEVPLLTPWLGSEDPGRGESEPASETSAKKMPEKAQAAGKPAKSGNKPRALKSARDSGADNLKQITGVGPKLENLLNSLGIFRFDQIANWSAAEVRWADEELAGFKGRASRDGWVAQAKTLASGGQAPSAGKSVKGKGR